MWKSLIFFILLLLVVVLSIGVLRVTSGSVLMEIVILEMVIVGQHLGG